jgi:hypothetical protein
LESLELKKETLEDKLKRFEEVQQKLEENKKIEETILKADMRLDELTREERRLIQRLVIQRTISKTVSRKLRRTKVSSNKLKRKKKN